MRKKAYRLHISSMLAILLATSCFFIMARPSRAHKLLIIPELEETQTHSLLSVKVHGNGSFFDGKAYRKEGTYVLTRHRRKLFSLLPDNGCELVQLVLNDEKIQAANTDGRLIISGSQKEQQLILYFRKTPWQKTEYILYIHAFSVAVSTVAIISEISLPHKFYRLHTQTMYQERKLKYSRMLSYKVCAIFC